MIAQLRGWTRTYSGDAITLIPPEGPALGAIRYRERVRPLARAGHVVASLLSRTPRLEVSAIGKAEPIVTREGEYGALIKVTGTLAGAPAQRDFGFVLYALRLETMQEERSAERQVFLDVARSAQPIPVPSTVEPKDVDVLVNHWAL